METLNITVGNGINNKARSESMPEGYVRSAVNVDMDNAGNARNRPGFTQLYSGDCHSFWKRYFVEGGDLKYLNADNTATTIKTGVGNEEISYTTIADRIYYSNGVVVGSIINGSFQAWGIDRPAFQPTTSASSHGGMFAGDYQVAITWLRNGEESGTINGSSISLEDGEGIRLSNFPVPPSDVTQVAVYVSSTNGKTFWLYDDEYPPDVSEVFVNSAISTIPLRTQFANKPQPFTIVQAHRGRIYGAVGRYLYYSNSQNYGLFDHNNYWTFPVDITCVISVQNMMYVGTKDKIYPISNIDSEGGVRRDDARNIGTTLTVNPVEDIDNEIVYAVSTKGMVSFTTEGVSDITATNLAMDEYKTSAITLIESDGFKKLISISQGIEKVSDLKASV